MQKIIFLTLYLFISCGVARANDLAEKSRLIPDQYQSVNVIDGEFVESRVDLNTIGPYGIELKRWSMPNGWAILPLDLFKGNEKPKESILSTHKMNYEYDKTGKIQEIRTVALDNSMIFNGIKIVANSDRRLDIETLNGKKLTYQFSDKALTSVKAPGFPEIKYTYLEKNKINTRTEPLGRCLSIEYNAEGKVKSLKSPSGANSSLCTTAQFIYRPGETEVLDALNRKSIYKYSKEKALISIENAFRTHRFFWKNGNIISKTLEDNHQQVYQCETFQFDPQGRLIKETLWGNLTGKNSSPFKVNADGQPIGSSIENYSKQYVFSEDKLLKIIEDNGKEIQFSYGSPNGLMESRFTVVKGEIVQREFYKYTPQGIIERTITDDGSTSNGNDLTGVTERHITQNSTFHHYPNQTLPQIIEEKYLDLTTKKECVLKQTFQSFSKEGFLLSQEIYNAVGKLQERVICTYDAEGRIKSTTDLEGHSITYTYDELGNPIRRSSSKDQLDTHFTYDYMNRLIREEELSTDGSRRCISNSYDLIGNKTASTDSCGNTTEYIYDGLNRLITTILPPVLDAQGQIVRYKTENTYDIFDRISSSTDAAGFITYTQYNVRGQPTRIDYPDGTCEIKIYNLDGTLHQSIDKKGCITRTNYDSLGNPTEVIETAPSGQTIQHTKFAYNGFHVVSKEILNGQRVLYSYDGAGRQKCELKGSTITEYSYDADGKVNSKTERFGPQFQDFRMTRIDSVGNYIFEDHRGINCTAQPQLEEPSNKETENRISNNRGQTVRQTSLINENGIVVETTYDALDRIEKIERKDPYGSKLSQIEYLYDASGNSCREIHTVITPQKPDRQYIIAKSWGFNHLLLEVIEGVGLPQQKITRYTHNSKGELTSFLKPDGTLITQDYDERGQLIALHASDQSFSYRYAYDSYGHITQAQDMLTGGITSCQCDSNGNIIHEKLSNGLESFWTYDDLGRLIEHIFPDRTSVLYKHNAVNVTDIERRQKNRTLTHHYQLDRESLRILESDLMGNAGKLRYDYSRTGLLIGLSTPFWSQEIKRDGRDNAGRIVESKITDPLGILLNQYKYDPLSHLIQENNQIYTYDSIDNRLSSNDQPWAYNEFNQLLNNYTYDLNGNVITSPGKKYSYDALNRLTRVTDGANESYQYIYDPLNRRIAKLHQFLDAAGNWKTLNSQFYFYSGQMEIGSTNEQRDIQELRILGLSFVGAEIGSSVLFELNGRNYVPIHDLQGSVRCLVDIDTKEIAEYYRYSAFGECTAHGSVKNPWQFSSKRMDPETHFIFFGKRFYIPEIGRWLTPDPIGVADGPNLYSYVHQNPLNANDLFGLFSISDVWKDITNLADTCINWFKTYLSSDAIEDYGSFAFYEAIGKGFAFLKGNSNFRSFKGVYGDGEINDKVRVTFINGVYTEPQYLADNVASISSSHGGVNVHYVYNATRGMVLDLFRALRVKLGFTSPEAYMLADTWRQLIAEMGGPEGNGTIVHYAHSIGAGDTVKALALISLEQRKMIHISTFGSPILIGNEDMGIGHVTNYVNIGDLACLLHPIKYFKAFYEGDHSIVFCGNFDGFPYSSHLFCNPVYQQVCSILGRYFVRMYDDKHF